MTDNQSKNIIIKKENINRLIKDVKYVINNPLNEHNIYYQHDDTNMLKGYAMIIGPENTPYFGGYYFFSIDYPPNYPYEPPIFKYHTNDGLTRFNPNLYINGKVCLSILNTWYGEQWSSCQNINTILLTLVTVFNDYPLLNEPGITKQTPNLLLYNKIIEYKNIDISILNVLNKKKFSNENFYLFFDIYLEYITKNIHLIKEKINDKEQLQKEEHYCSIYKMKTTIDYKKLNEKYDKIISKLINNKN